MKIGVITYKNNIPSRPETDVFEELAACKELKEKELDVLKKVRDRELQVLNAKNTRAEKKKREEKGKKKGGGAWAKACVGHSVVGLACLYRQSV